MRATVADIIRILEGFFPRRLAEEWDNVGLQVGRMDSAVADVWVALDRCPRLWPPPAGAR